MFLWNESHFPISLYALRFVLYCLTKMISLSHFYLFFIHVCVGEGANAHTRVSSGHVLSMEVRGQPAEVYSLLLGGS